MRCNRVLLLNADYTALKVVSWEKAVCMVFERKVQVVVDHESVVLRSQNLTMPMPSVIVLKRYTNVMPNIRYNRTNLMARDRHTCTYCGYAPKTQEGLPSTHNLTVDHVVPRCRAKSGFVQLPWNKQNVGVTSWSNVTTACLDCNAKKADRTPDEAGMTLARIPFKPSISDIVLMAVARMVVPEDWKLYLPAR